MSVFSPPPTGTISIIGAGNIGRLVGAALVRKLGSEQIRVSVRERTSSKVDLLSAAGLGDCITDNQSALDSASLVLLAVRPQDFPSLISLKFSSTVPIVSLMAAVSFRAIARLTGVPEALISRVCLCGHDPLAAGNGVWSSFPAPSPTVHHLFEEIAGIRMLAPLTSERQCHIFCVVIVLPAAFVVLYHEGRSYTLEEAAAVVEHFSPTQPLDCLKDIFAWSDHISKPLLYDKALSQGTISSSCTFDVYLDQMFTRGGMTEALALCLRRGGSLADALTASIEHCFTLVAQNDTQIL